jgi:hypothetical protein
MPVRFVLALCLAALTALFVVPGAEAGTTILWTPPIGEEAQPGTQYVASVVNTGPQPVIASILICNLAGACSPGNLTEDPFTTICTNATLQPGESCSASEVVPPVTDPPTPFIPPVYRYAKFQLSGDGPIRATGALYKVNRTSGEMLGVEAN